MTERDLFMAALPIDDAVARRAYLDEACGSDAALRGRVDALLAAFEQAGAFLGQPAASWLTDYDQPPPAADVDCTDTAVGPYKLIERIGEGGMGEVWMAQQTEPVKRLVAVKLIKPGMDSRSVLGRFDAERQALALMDHPNIARVLDAGATADGRPYFVMELVKGVPITRYCDDHHLTPRQRLELFVPVCQAVQHAHQKGVIHRDLKPSNVLVAEYDDRPVPKVIDFGVAKATGPRLTGEALHTGFGAIVGTIEYMSPEQARFNALDIDTRSDVYSLGVLLYELLTGGPPFGRRELEAAGLDEMLRVIREREPSKPSNKLSTDDRLPSLAAERGTEPGRLTRLLRGDLDWVVLKCLEKQRDRRYQTANGLATDLQRFLADEPVDARPPTAGYRLRKFVRRNKGPVLAASLVLLALVAGVTGTTLGLFEARRQEGLARSAAEEERKAKLDADARRTEAETNLAYAKKGYAILGSVFAGLNPAANYETVAELHNALRDNLNKAVKDLDGSAIGDPLEVSAIQHILGESLLGLGEANLAIEVLLKGVETHKTRLGLDHADTLAGTMNLARAVRAAGNLDKALPLFEETLRQMRTKLGPDHQYTLTCLGNLADAYRAAGNLGKALRLLEEAVERRTNKFGPDHPETLACMSNLALGYRTAGNLDKALPLFEETLRRMRAKLGPDHPNTLVCMHNLASAYQGAGQLAKALPLFEETVGLMKAKLGPDHPKTLDGITNLASAYVAAGKVDQAVPLLEETLKVRQAKFGPDHPETVTCVNHLASAYLSAGKSNEAVPLYEDVFKFRRARLGPDNPQTLNSMINLASGYRAVGKSDRALPLLEEAVGLAKAKLGPDHPITLVGMTNLATVYRATGKLDRALLLTEETLGLQSAKLGRDHPTTLMTMNNLAVFYRAAGKLDQALPLFEDALTLRKAKLGPDHPDTLKSMKYLGVAYGDAKQVEKAAAMLADYVASTRAATPKESTQLVTALVEASCALVDCGQFPAAETYAREALAIRVAKEPDLWTTFFAQALLGATLAGQQKYADAEPLLLQGYEGMKQRSAKMGRADRHRLPEAAVQLMKLCEATARPAEAAKWLDEAWSWVEAAG